jgi:hypothetical protein
MAADGALTRAESLPRCALHVNSNPLGCNLVLPPSPQLPLPHTLPDQGRRGGQILRLPIPQIIMYKAQASPCRQAGADADADGCPCRQSKGISSGDPPAWGSDPWWGFQFMLSCVQQHLGMSDAWGGCSRCPVRCRFCGRHAGCSGRHVVLKPPTACASIPQHNYGATSFLLREHLKERTMRRAVGGSPSPPCGPPPIARESVETPHQHIQMHEEPAGVACDGQEWDNRIPSPPPPPARPPPPQHLSPLWLTVWLLVAAAVPVMVALLGVCARYLQASCGAACPKKNALHSPCLAGWSFSFSRCLLCPGSTGCDNPALPSPAVHIHVERPSPSHTAAVLLAPTLDPCLVAASAASSAAPARC